MLLLTMMSNDCFQQIWIVEMDSMKPFLHLLTVVISQAIKHQKHKENTAQIKNQ